MSTTIDGKPAISPTQIRKQHISVEMRARALEIEVERLKLELTTAVERYEAAERRNSDLQLRYRGVPVPDAKSARAAKAPR